MVNVKREVTNGSIDTKLSVRFSAGGCPAIQEYGGGAVVHGARRRAGVSDVEGGAGEDTGHRRRNQSSRVGAAIESDESGGCAGVAGRWRGIGRGAAESGVEHHDSAQGEIGDGDPGQLHGAGPMEL